MDDIWHNTRLILMRAWLRTATVTPSVQIISLELYIANSLWGSGLQFKAFLSASSHLIFLNMYQRIAVNVALQMFCHLQHFHLKDL